MKKLTSILLIFVLVLTSFTFTYAISEKLANHWANDLVDRVFLAYYFPYLANDNFKLFEPNSAISTQNFNLSLASLFKDNDYTISGVGGYGTMSRGALADNLGSKLLEIGVTNEKNNEVPFKDINTMSEGSIELLRLLYNNGIIAGDSSSIYSPERNLSQVEAIIIMQRVKGVLENMNSVAFTTTGIVQTYNNQEEIIVKTNGDKVMVTITKEFPNPGYSMSIAKIKREKEGYRIFFDITPPKPDSIQLQVITYKTLTMEIEKDKLENPPYKFILDGFNNVSTIS